MHKEEYESVLRCLNEILSCIHFEEDNGSVVNPVIHQNASKAYDIITEAMYRDA